MIKEFNSIKEKDLEEIEDENKILKSLMEKIFRETNSEFYEFSDGNCYAIKIGDIQIPLEYDEFDLIVNSILHVDLDDAEVIEEDYSYMIERKNKIN